MFYPVTARLKKTLAGACRQLAGAAALAAALMLLPGCGEEAPPLSPSPVETDSGIGADEIIRIPVVVHVLYSKDEFNISDEKIASQLAVLNQDFRKQNADHRNTPAEFAPLAADAGIEFYLATRDPRGRPTSGITRTFTTVNGWDGHDLQRTLPVEALKLYFTDKGGHDAWPTDQYLNIWVAEMTDRHGKVGLPGHARPPGTNPRIDGIVIDPRVFGTLPPLTEAHRLGRTATHEVGHWLNLLHIFGTTADCHSVDSVADTPPAHTAYTGNPSYPQYSCGQSSLFMNFMDYVNDESMYMFTRGQRERMRAVFTRRGGRYGLYKHVTGKMK